MESGIGIRIKNRFKNGKIIHKINYKKVFYFLFFAIIVISSIPNISTPKISFSPKFSIRTDYIFHFLEYLFLVLSFLLWKIEEHNKIKKIYFVFVFLFFVTFAFLEEIHQKIIPGRVCNPIDFLYDCIGVVSAIFFIVIRLSKNYD